jgi:hypothetical protein
MEVTQMASRWTQQKVAKQKAYRSTVQGRHPRFHGWTFEETQQKVEIKGRALCPMPDNKTSNDATIATYAGKITKYAVGEHNTRDGYAKLMPQGSYGLTMRKAKGGKVPLWTGTDRRPNNAVAAPAGKGMLRNNWSTNTQPYLIKKA